MVMPGDKWAFVRPCGCVYGVLFDHEEQISTPIQAWYAFYESGGRKAARKGNTVRLWREGDRLVLPEKDPHRREL